MWWFKLEFASWSVLLLVFGAWQLLITSFLNVILKLFLKRAAGSEITERVKVDNARPELCSPDADPCIQHFFKINGLWDCYTHSSPSHSSQPQFLLLLLPVPHPSHYIVTCSLLMDCAPHLLKHCLGQAKTAN